MIIAIISVDQIWFRRHIHYITVILILLNVVNR